MMKRLLPLMLALASPAWGQIINNGGGGGGSVTAFSGANGLIVTNPTTTPSLTIPNNTQYTAGLSGTTWAERVATALAALPSNGGTIDASGECAAGNPTAADENVIIGSDTKPTKLILGSCSYSLGTHQALYFKQTEIIGKGFATTGNLVATTLINNSATLATLAYGGSAQPTNVYFSNFVVVNSGGAGSIALNLTQVEYSSFEKMRVQADTGVYIGGVGNCACYNTFNKIFSQSTTYGWHLKGNSAASQIYNSTAGGSSTVGMFFDGAEAWKVYALDVEGSTGNAVEISGPGGLDDIYGIYLEANAGPIVLDSGTTGNYIVGNGASGASVYDNSGNTSNYYKLLGGSGDDGSWGPTDVVGQSLFWGQSILGDYNDKNGLTIGGGSAFDLDFYWYGQSLSVYGNWGHAPFNVGQLTTLSGIADKGAISTATLATPTQPTITQGGTAGSTSASYYVVCRDKNGGYTLPSSAGSTSTGNASLSATNYNIITWPAEDGCWQWDILKANTSTSLATGQRPPVTGTVGGSGTIAFNDTGQSTNVYTPPTANTTDNVHRSPRAISALPTNNVSAGDTYVVNNWNGTIGQCTAGSPNLSTVAVYESGNAQWDCP